MSQIAMFGMIGASLFWVGFCLMVTPMTVKPWPQLNEVGSVQSVIGFLSSIFGVALCLAALIIWMRGAG